MIFSCVSQNAYPKGLVAADEHKITKSVKPIGPPDAVEKFVGFLADAARWAPDLGEEFIDACRELAQRARAKGRAA